MERPWVQIAIDALDLERAKKLAKIAMEAGADWIEAGTPLITFESVRAIGVLAKLCTGIPIVADFKAQDGVAKYFKEAGRQGAQVATVLGVVANGSIKAAIHGGSQGNVAVCADMYSVGRRNLARRAKELEELGVHYIMLHLGFDEARDEPDKRPLDGLEELVRAVRIPVGVGTFGLEDAVEAVRRGASFIVQGEPVLSMPDAQARMSEFIAAIKEAR